MTLAGAGAAPLLAEVPYGCTCGPWRGPGHPEPGRRPHGRPLRRAARPRPLDLALDPDTLAAAGTALGCGAIRFLAPTSARSPSRPPPSPTYAEDFGDGRAFAEAAAAAGKPVVLLPAGRAPPPRAARSPTPAP
ncbi:hypothetical protein O1L68_38355 [Streptomyces lydicus]|nr:hypothetical protein [Streptomyces lydicus]